MSTRNPQQELQIAVEIAGGQTALANLINMHLLPNIPKVRQQHVHWWLNSGKKISAKYAVPCELALSGKVLAKHLRPDIFNNTVSEGYE